MRDGKDMRKRQMFYRYLLDGEHEYSEKAPLLKAFSLAVILL
jgi:hypothetical protein